MGSDDPSCVYISHMYLVSEGVSVQRRRRRRGRRRRGRR